MVKPHNLYSMTEQELQELAGSGMEGPVCLLNDFVFKQVFHKQKALRGFLSALLEVGPEEITDIEYLDADTSDEYDIRKEGVMDLRIYLMSKGAIHVELQVRRFPYWEDRSLYYLSKMYMTSLSGKEQCSSSEFCIHIGILDFYLRNPMPFYSAVELWSKKTAYRNANKFGLRVLSLKQMEGVSEKTKESQLYQWARMLKAETWEELEELSEQNEYIKEAVQELKAFSGDPHMRYTYLKKEFAEHFTIVKK